MRAETPLNNASASERKQDEVQIHISSQDLTLKQQVEVITTVTLLLPCFYS